MPDGDLFKAIGDGTASVVTDTIETFTPTGLRLTSGEELEADVIVTATGLELLFIGGMELVVDGDPVEVSEHLVYKGMMLEGVPNLAVAVGYTNASWTLKADLTAGYVCRLLALMRAKGLRQAMPVDHGEEMDTGAFLGLNSGYILRSADRFPKQGDRFPWQVHQSYVADVRDIRRRPIEDGTLVLSSPAPRVAGNPRAVRPDAVTGAPTSA